MQPEANVPKKWGTNSCFLLHDNAPAHRSVLVKDFLAKYSVTTLEHSPYFPDMAEVDFYMFHLTENNIEGTALL